MFSGIVQKTGRLMKKRQQRDVVNMTFQTSAWDKAIKKGESICVDGVCLTAAAVPKRNQFSAQVVPETLAQTTLGVLRIRDRVNLERSLKWGERIGGHFVLGHVDGVGVIAKKSKRGKSYELVIELNHQILQNLVPKGSVAVDGISLTIQKITARSVTVALIPHTAQTTSLGRKRRGDKVNIEADVIAKHLARWVHPETSRAQNI